MIYFCFCFIACKWTSWMKKGFPIKYVWHSSNMHRYKIRHPGSNRKIISIWFSTESKNLLIQYMTLNNSLYFVWLDHLQLLVVQAGCFKMFHTEKKFKAPLQSKLRLGFSLFLWLNVLASLMCRVWHCKAFFYLLCSKCKFTLCSNKI